LVVVAIYSSSSSISSSEYFSSSYRQKLWMREKGDVPFWGS